MRGRCAARNGIIWVKQMKQLITALCMAYAAAAFASPRIDMPSLPEAMRRYGGIRWVTAESWILMGKAFLRKATALLANHTKY